MSLERIDSNMTSLCCRNSAPYCTCRMLHCWMATCCKWLASCCRRSAVRQMARFGITSSGTCRALWHSCTACTCCLKLSISANSRCKNRESSQCVELLTNYNWQSKQPWCFKTSQSYHGLFYICCGYLSLSQLFFEALASQLWWGQCGLDLLQSNMQGLNFILQGFHTLRT